MINEKNYPMIVKKPKQRIVLINKNDIMPRYENTDDYVKDIIRCITNLHEYTYEKLSEEILIAIGTIQYNEYSVRKLLREMFHRNELIIIEDDNLVKKGTDWSKYWDGFYGDGKKIDDLIQEKKTNPGKYIGISSFTTIFCETESIPKEEYQEIEFWGMKCKARLDKKYQPTVNGFSQNALETFAEFDNIEKIEKERKELGNNRIPSKNKIYAFYLPPKSKDGDNNRVISPQEEQRYKKYLELYTSHSNKITVLESHETLDEHILATMQRLGTKENIAELWEMVENFHNEVFSIGRLITQKINIKKYKYICQNINDIAIAVTNAIPKMEIYCEIAQGRLVYRHEYEPTSWRSDRTKREITNKSYSEMKKIILDLAEYFKKYEYMTKKLQQYFPILFKEQQ